MVPHPLRIRKWKWRKRLSLSLSVCVGGGGTPPPLSVCRSLTPNTLQYWEDSVTSLVLNQSFQVSSIFVVPDLTSLGELFLECTFWSPSCGWSPGGFRFPRTCGLFLGRGFLLVGTDPVGCVPVESESNSNIKVYACSSTLVLFFLIFLTTLPGIHWYQPSNRLIRVQ